VASLSSRLGQLALAFAGFGLASWLSVGCGGSPNAPAKNEPFYLHGGGKIDKNAGLEVYFPPLNQAQTVRIPKIVGVGIFNGDVRFGRPIDWYIRGADYTHEKRYISYQSPRQFLFSFYERLDSPEETWTDVLRRYEADVRAQGSEFLAARMPIATANTQGREYIIKTRVAGKPDYMGFSNEILIRSEHRIMMVQIAHGENFDAAQDEIVAALRSIIMY
jgi:hypothetical protein